MITGVAREIKKDEYRVAMLPVGAHLLTEDGHTVLAEKGAGLGSGYEDSEYEQAGALQCDPSVLPRTGRAGLDAFIEKSECRAKGLNMRDGKITCPAVSEAFPDLPTA